MKKIGDRIKYYRTTKGWTQEEVADKLHISRLSYSRIERSVTDLPYSRLEQIAKVFDVSIVDLVSTPGKNKPDYQKLLLEKEEKINQLQNKIIQLMDNSKKKKGK